MKNFVHRHRLRVAVLCSASRALNFFLSDAIVLIWFSSSTDVVHNVFREAERMVCDDFQILSAMILGNWLVDGEKQI